MIDKKISEELSCIESNENGENYTTDKILINETNSKPMILSRN